MIYFNNQIIFPEDFRVPNYSISPFSTEKLADLNTIVTSENLSDQERFLSEEFGNHEFFMSAKKAIFKALSFYDLQKNDEVYIVTTTGNTYVSSCVTKEIEKYCKWSRTLSDNTKLLFVIHEFGTICKDLESLSKLNIPIIEDFAMSLFSEQDLKAKNYSDFKIYSLPKFFPVQFGGVLKYNNDTFLPENGLENQEYFQLDLKKIAHHFLLKKEQIITKRKTNYAFYQKAMTGLDAQCTLELSDNETPSVYMFSSDSIDLDGLKIFLQKNGIECSKFYGQNSFFLPVHQYLEEFDINYIVNLIKYFAYENK